MHTLSEIPQIGPASNSGNPPAMRSASLMGRLPRRSVCHFHAIPLAGETEPAADDEADPSKIRRRYSQDRPQVRVSAFPSPDRACRHHVFVEDGARLKKLDLPATARVALSQRFDAAAGDILSYDYVILLNRGTERQAASPSVRSLLVSKRTETAVCLFDQSMKDHVDVRGPSTTASFRKSLSYRIPVAGPYELRFVTLIEPSDPGSAAQLIVKHLQLTSAKDHEQLQFAALSCVGRVRVY